MNAASLGHNTADYLHGWIESSKLAFADREAYYGDPDFDDVPLDELLSYRYAETRASQIGERASYELRPGDVGNGVPGYTSVSVAEDNRAALGVEAREVRDLGLGHAHIGDTTHLDAMDAEGNMVAATPSGGWLGTSPVIKGLGFPLGTRGQMFYLNSDRPNALQPTAPARHTHAHDGHPRRRAVHGLRHSGRRLAGAVTIQFFLNHVDFGMNLQEALDAPTVHTTHFPVVVLSARRLPGASGGRIAHPVRRAGRTGTPRPRDRADGRLGERQGNGHTLARGQGSHRGRGFREEYNRVCDGALG